MQPATYTDAQRAFIQNTIDGRYDDGPSTNPSIRRRLRDALYGLYVSTQDGDFGEFQRWLGILRAASYRQLITLTGEDFAVLDLVLATTRARISTITADIDEIGVYAASLRFTRTVQSPELRERYELAVGQQRPLPL